MSLNVRLLKKTDFNRLLLFLRQFGTHHYQMDPLFCWEGAHDYVANLIFQFSRKDPVFLTVENGNIKGLIAFSKREWDTKHFGYPVASIDYFFAEKNDKGYVVASLLVDKFTGWANENLIKLSSIKVFPNHNIVRALEENGFYSVGEELILSKSLPDPNLNGLTDDGIRFFKESDKDALLVIAKNAMWMGRFHSDPNIEKSKADQVYAGWLNNGIKKENAKITVLELCGKPSGFILWSTENLARESGKLLVGDQELVAIDPSIRGKGYGRILYRGTLIQMQESGVNLVKTGISANNAPALNNQAKLGFYFHYSAAIFHKFVS